MRILKPLACALAAIGACASPVVAAPCAETGCEVTLLEEIVVTARRAPRIVLDASETIGVIDREQLARSPMPCAACPACRSPTRGSRD